ncbi:hypothetical protein [Hymenobacter lucidus]|uniref:DUF1571 domain-containing protein n=1 Tax=Hymenobacter lucidus TaxID=2880930 RepID=A0ABS8AYK0_9BACT|nr:hypothetical protein [Hymenobacter lucidus]MCB2410889.1 hypothetical protein [Hymenobacter lucidus]
MKHVFGIALGILLPHLPGAPKPDLRAVEQEILQEGLTLYQSERASWVATDLLLAQKPDMSGMGGYLSYIEGDSVRTVFFQKPSQAGPLYARFIFSFAKNTIEPQSGHLLAGRPATATEQKLYTVRQHVNEELYEHKVQGSAYGFPQNTRPNIALVERRGHLRAYVLTGPQEGRVLPIGNDFMMEIGPDLQVRSVERLHRSYLALELPEGQTVESSIHSHLPAHPYITATDICAMLLYQQIFPAPQHTVISPDYVSLFNAPQQQLTIITRKAFEKIAKHK